MITFKTLTIQNFLGFGAIPTVINFDQPGTTLINGYNGVGKTSIINALVYTLYDKPLSNGIGRKDDLINNINNKEMVTTLSFERGGIEYEILRARKMKTGQGNNYVTITKDGKDITPDSIANGNRLIESIINIPYELFIRIAAISASCVPFLDLPVKAQSGASQTAIIEELFDLTTLSTKADILKEKIKETKHNKELQTTKLTTLEDERERYQSQLESTKKRKKQWELDTDEAISELQDELKTLSEIDIEAEAAIFDEIENFKEELRELRPQYKDFKIILRENNTKKSEAENQLVHLSDGNCPYCKQAMSDAKKSIASTKKIIKLANTAIQEADRQINELESFINTIDEKISTLESEVTVNNVEALYKISSRIERYQDKLNSLMQSKNPHSETLDELLSVDISDFDMESINELDTLLKHQDMVLKLLTKKDSFVRKSLINNNIPFLNGRLNHYLDELGLTQIIEFKHDMTATISKFGRALDFGNLSAGQRSRVNLAMSFAFRDLLQNLYGQINICLLDEILDTGLDEEGALLATEMVRKKGMAEGICLYVISHKAEIKSQFTRSITVTMVDDFTIVGEVEDLEEI